MADKKLQEFYTHLAFGEFDLALEHAEKAGPFGDENEKIIIQALRLKKILQKTACLKEA